MNTVSRRDFLLGTSGSLAALGVAGCNDGDSSDFEPTEVTDITLDVAFTEFELAGRRVKLRTYNGKVPGPTMTVRPGGLLRVQIRNRLPHYDSSQWEKDLHVLGHQVGMNVPHLLNTTNLHVHGMDVIPHLFEPIGTERPDSVMIAVGPGEEKRYEFEIPGDHPSGLYWYHPHHHGSTAVQALNGMAGLIVVEGPIDDVPEIAAAQDIRLAVQDIALFESREEPGLFMYDPPQNAVWNTFSGTANVMKVDGTVAEADVESGFSTGDYPLRLYLVNGQPVYEETHNSDKDMQQMPKGKAIGQVPRYTARPGEVVRIRLLNGCSDNLLPLVVDGHTMHLIALDGKNFPAVQAIAYTDGATELGQEQVLVPPGGRAEFLVQASAAPGVYKIRELSHGTSTQFLASEGMTIAELEVAGDPLEMPLPSTLPAPTRYYPLATDLPVAAERSIQFSMNFMDAPKNKILGIDFMVNGEHYDETRVPIESKLGTTEVWTLAMDGGDSAEGHPFHIHTNSFEVLQIGDRVLDPPRVQDTVWVPHHTEVTIRMHFKEFVGKAVFHCHILPHEDSGMMMNVLIKA